MTYPKWYLAAVRRREKNPKKFAEGDSVAVDTFYPNSPRGFKVTRILPSQGNGVSFEGEELESNILNLPKPKKGKQTINVFAAQILDVWR